MEALADVLARSKPRDTVMESYKSFHASVSKLSKKVDKLRASDYAAAGRTAPLDAGALRELIILH